MCNFPEILWLEDKNINNLGLVDDKIAVSIGMQKMVRSDRAGSGTMVTLNTPTDFDFKDVILINAVWGLSEHGINTRIDPDRYIVDKDLLKNASPHPIAEKHCGGKHIKMVCSDGNDTVMPHTTKATFTTDNEKICLVLNDREVVQLAHWAVLIEDHFGKPMDIEWTKDGLDGKLYLVQARPKSISPQARREKSIVNPLRCSSKAFIKEMSA